MGEVASSHLTIPEKTLGIITTLTTKISPLIKDPQSNIREFQLQSINAGAFYDNSFMSINAKTGYGTSLVALAIASMRRGVSIEGETDFCSCVIFILDFI